LYFVQEDKFFFFSGCSNYDADTMFLRKLHASKAPVLLLTNTRY